MRFYRPLWLVFSLAVVILGIACIINPLDTMIFLAYFVGFVMIFSGLGEIAYFIQTRFYIMLFDGIISCVLGLILLFGGEEIAGNFIPYLVALWLMFKGVLWLIHTYRLWQILKVRKTMLLVSVAYIALGVVFMIFPQILSAIISLALGILLMFSGIIGLWVWNRFRILDRL